MCNIFCLEMCSQRADKRKLLCAFSQGRIDEFQIERPRVIVLSFLQCILITCVIQCSKMTPVSSTANVSSNIIFEEQNIQNIGWSIILKKKKTFIVCMFLSGCKCMSNAIFNTPLLQIIITFM